MSGWKVLALGLLCGVACAQKTTSKATDDGYHLPLRQQVRPADGDPRPAAERMFPQAWYDAALAETTMVAPILGSPLSGRLSMTMRSAGRHRAGEPGITYESYKFAQDGTGRVRLEREPKYDRSIPETDLQMIEPGYVFVFDPVKRCNFSWREDAAKRASVSCMQPGKAFAGQDGWDMEDMDEQAWRKLHPDAQSSNEPMGRKKMFGIVEGEGYKHYETAKDYLGKSQKTYWGERWYAPSLKALVMSTNYDQQNEHSSVEYKDYEVNVQSRAEPDAGLFYPPKGYRIEVAKAGKP